jgi:hypothetical protein
MILSNVNYLGGGMTYYRLYFMSARTGHIEHFREFEVAGDEDAIRVASEHAGAQPIELWCGRRKVARTEAGAACPVKFSTAAEYDPAPVPARGAAT